MARLDLRQAYLHSLSFMSGTQLKKLHPMPYTVQDREELR